MNIGIGKRQLVITVEKIRTEPVEISALIGASDREVERLARTLGSSREPRWDVSPSFFGYRN